MVRPYYVGKAQVTQPVFDLEVKRLLALGLKQNEIAGRIRRPEGGPCDRKTIWRAMRRLGAATVEEVRKEGAWVQMTHDSFRGLPEVLKYAESMQMQRLGARGIGQTLGTLKRFCEDLQIFPSQLDVDWSKRWVGTHPELADNQMRSYKVALRKWLKFALGTTDEVLKSAGLDAKHYLVGQFATINLSERQIEEGVEWLRGKASDRALLAFRLGSECCCPKQEMLGLKAENIVEVEKGVTVLRTFRGKTGSYWTKYPHPLTVRLLRETPEPYFTEAIVENGVLRDLRACYSVVEAQGEYFNLKPLHALRHVGAIRLLRKNNWNRAICAVLGGWEAEKTLEDHYGAVPDELIHAAGVRLWK